jgi:hypothetical protein
MQLETNTIWMIVSGAMGFAFFFIANFSRWFKGANQIAAYIQLAINAFVFVSYSTAIDDSVGLKKLIAIAGSIIPIIMASITIYRVLWRQRQPKGAD